MVPAEPGGRDRIKTDGSHASGEYNDTKSSFHIPHDLNILQEVFNIQGGEYNKVNGYWKSFSIIDQIKKNEDSNKHNLIKKIDKIKQLYADLSTQYQDAKISNNIPLK